MLTGIHHNHVTDINYKNSASILCHHQIKLVKRSVKSNSIRLLSDLFRYRLLHNYLYEILFVNIIILKKLPFNLIHPHLIKIANQLLNSFFHCHLRNQNASTAHQRQHLFRLHFTSNCQRNSERELIYGKDGSTI